MSTQTKVTTFVTKSCKHFDEATYSQRTKYYSDKKRPELADFIQYLYNAAERYIETGTVQHLSNAVTAGRGQARLNVAVRIMKSVSAHAWNGKKFAGKMDRQLFSKKTKGWKQSFMEQVQKELDRDMKQASEAPAWDLDAKILNLFKSAATEKHGSHTPRDVLEHVQKVAKQFVA